jgi:hypothetical protein
MKIVTQNEPDVHSKKSKSVQCTPNRHMQTEIIHGSKAVH